MTLQELIIKWDNLYRYDYWWRKKYRIPFNSEQHRNANPIDIAFDYLENAMSNKAMEQFKKEEEKSERFKKDDWISQSEEINKRIEEMFDKVDLKDL